ncbi:class I SAM-dependent methyltransferase [Caulobacter sp. KR2-114]|uniref:class I SAM-dependent methyltransferase n=1 Tax=Caulobacter sp. KR2-114 TaxID=3400912 RepID=UPI003C0F7E38
MLTVRLERLGLTPGQWVLDLGCGEGRHVHGVQMLGGVNVVGLDLDLPSLAKAREGAAMLAGDAPAAAPAAVTAVLRGDAYRLPFADAAFDVVICSEVLEHLHDYEHVLAEIRRVLKPDGLFCPTVPRAWPERICWALAPGPGGYADQPGGHVRIFEESALKSRISALGFTYLGKHHAHALHSPYWWLKCAFWPRRDDHPLVRAYHRLLVWDLMQRPWLTRALEALLQPLMGKSTALYFRGAA